MSKLWGGRFSEETHDAVKRLNDSLSFDARLWAEDIDGSIAHATMLGETSIIKLDEANAIVEGLKAIKSGLQNGSIGLPCDAEDIHSAIESLLFQNIGPCAGKLHTARSRNDQVATDSRLFVRKSIDEMVGRLEILQTTFVQIAELEIETIMPGYTHLQTAQPISLAHHLMAYFWMFQRDKERLADARKRVNAMPLGSGALAGTTFPIDRQRVAELLGFDAITENSIDAVSDRDFVVEFLSAGALLGVHLSRLGEEIVLWNSNEFGFVELSDSVATGSSMMPQKKNPDVAELARGKAGRLIGNLVTLLTTLKGLPLAYNKDMQEDKEPLFDTVDTLSAVLDGMTVLVQSISFNKTRMSEALKGGHVAATDLADELVRQGLSFREAHTKVGHLVASLAAKGVDLSEATVEGSSLPEIDLSARSCVDRRDGEGGTAISSVRKQINQAKKALSPKAEKVCV